MLVVRGCALGLAALTTPDISEQKIVGLHAVLPGNNWVAFTLSGAYTVDWGDGTTENFAAGVTAYRNLAWSSYNTSTLTARGYRQSDHHDHPQSGHNITSWNFLVKTQPARSVQWLFDRLAGHAALHPPRHFCALSRAVPGRSGTG